jgi:hypothetical protein
MQVCCVVKYSSDIYQDHTINEVNKHTSKLGLKFTAREYDSWNYSNDRQVIRSLPAFHVYFDSIYIDTFYPEDNVSHLLERWIEEYGKLQLEKCRFIKPWKSVILRRWKSKID